MKEKEIKKGDTLKKRINKNKADSSLIKDSIKLDTLKGTKNTDTIDIDTIDLQPEKEVKSIFNNKKDTLAKDTITRRHIIYLTESNNFTFQRTEQGI